MVRIRHRIALVVAVLIGALVIAVPSAPASQVPLGTKVAERVLVETADGQQASFLVLLGSRADLSAAARLSDKAAKGRFVYQTLRTSADRDQAPLRAILDQLGASYTSHFMANMLRVTGDRAAVEGFARWDFWAVFVVGVIVYHGSNRS